MITSDFDLETLLSRDQKDLPLIAEVLLQNYRNYIFKFSLTIVGDVDDAEDICQDTFIDALIHIDQYNSGTNMKAWLSKIALNNCYRFFRKKKVSTAFISIQKAILSISSPQSTPPEAIAKKQETTDLLKAVSTLDMKHKIPLVLFYGFNFKIHEIARLMNIPEGTVSSRLFYALKKIQEALESD